MSQDGYTAGRPSRPSSPSPPLISRMASGDTEAGALNVQ